MTLDELFERVYPEPNSGCWIFEGDTSHGGYPRAKIDGRIRRVHRHSLEMKVGRKLQRDELACHSCDVRSCCNQDHLFVGTNLDNVRDKVAKGRAAPPPTGKRKLTAERARVIRAARAGGASVSDIASAFSDVSRRQIERVLAGSRWAA
jgi:hypothetical protein